MRFNWLYDQSAPWPPKIILHNVVGKHKLPEFITGLRDFSFGA
jgi:hypothetical protein